MPPAVTQHILHSHSFLNVTFTSLSSIDSSNSIFKIVFLFFKLPRSLSSAFLACLSPSFIFFLYFLLFLLFLFLCCSFLFCVCVCFSSCVHFLSAFCLASSSLYISSSVVCMHLTPLIKKRKRHLPLHPFSLLLKSWHTSLILLDFYNGAD